MSPRQLPGGGCGAGALAAGIPALASPVTNTGHIALDVVTNATIGGLASVAGGGEFANGALTGAFGYLLNSCLHGGCSFSEPLSGADPLDPNENKILLVGRASSAAIFVAPGALFAIGDASIDLGLGALAKYGPDIFPSTATSDRLPVSKLDPLKNPLDGTTARTGDTSLEDNNIANSIRPTPQPSPAGPMARFIETIRALTKFGAPFEPPH